MGPNALFVEVVTAPISLDSWRINMNRVGLIGPKKTAVLVLLILLVTCIPALAQIELSGSWVARNDSDALSNNPGPRALPLDFLGIPLNHVALVRGLLYSPSKISMPERSCAGYPPIYLLMGPFGLKISNESEPRNGTTVAWKINGWEDRAPTTIWMDGRPHPSKYAPHPMGGFTTGTWENDVLTTFTTHMKAGEVRRSGAPSSDQATMTARFFRHGDILTVTARIDDPFYLAEPYYLTRTFQLDILPAVRSVGQPCIQVDEGVPEGSVPHFLPGKNPFLNEVTKAYNIPPEAVLGGPETMYPEYRKKLKDTYHIPAKCPTACGGPGQYPLRQQ